MNFYTIRGRYNKTVEEEVTIKAPNEREAHKRARDVFAKQGRVFETKIIEEEVNDAA